MSIANLISQSLPFSSSSKRNANIHSPPRSISFRPIVRISNTIRAITRGGGQTKDNNNIDHFHKSNKSKQPKQFELPGLTKTDVKAWAEEKGIEASGGEVVKVKMNKGKCIHQGLITESLPNGMFRVRIENIESLILGYISAKIRDNKIMILVGDKVEIEVDHRYDSSKGRIIYRVDNRSHKAGKKAKKDQKQNNRRRS
ncbi:hypothetical protein C5167_050062 [Papaver somniferum]|uniref:S1-like domain-containing protein n=1 Tax=Papaver somniferum TaxID=3469 RepID=A0A4Y7KRH2_PAPSO|nr:uncharacterized protein LOC113303050 [Papaver somniferum]RZC74569.1 hypothetical protein C5167_050062 [Papaver somniferum]